MCAGRPLGSVRVKEKGPLHQRLHKLLRDAWLAKAITQDSLAKAIGHSQENVGQYLRGKKAGALDLDQAVRALEHVGSNLPDFLAGHAPQELTPTDKLARALTTRPELAGLVEDLLPVPKTKLADVIALTRGLARVATTTRGAQTSEHTDARPKGRRTTTGSRKRRSAPADT